MPLHLQSIVNDEKESEYIADLLLLTCETPDGAFVSEDKYLHTLLRLKDDVTDDPFGKLVFTIKINDEENTLQILDLDITLDNENRTELRFLDLRPGSSDANEYYDAYTEENGAHLELETVCRHAVKEELTGSCRDVSISAFPFKLSVFENLKAYNKAIGMDKKIKVKGTEYSVCGMSEYFIMPGGTLGTEEEEESFTYLLGTVTSWKDVRWRLGKNVLEFVLVWLDTALGRIPAAMGRDVFDLSDLAIGSLIAMYADIKADMSVFLNAKENADK